MRHYNENKVIFQGSSYNRNNVFTYIWMKLPDCAFNIDVESSFTFWDPIIFSGVTACQREAEIKKTPCTLTLLFDAEGEKTFEKIKRWNLLSEKWKDVTFFPKKWKIVCGNNLSSIILYLQNIQIQPDIKTHVDILRRGKYFCMFWKGNLVKSQK